MSGHNPKIVGSLKTRFHMPTFLRCVLLDLRENLGDSYDTLIRVVDDPHGFRSSIGALLADADCMASTPYYAALRQVDACVSKLNSWGSASSNERQANALAKFLKAEKVCAITNKRLAFYSKHPMRLRPIVRRVINQAIDYMYSALGALPSNDELFENSGFGPGLTFGLSGREMRDLLYKIDHDQTTTPGCKTLAVTTLRESFPNWAQHLVEKRYCLATVAGNRVAYVPKTASIDRTIGIEPSLNVFLQKGVDVYMRRRLRAHMGLRLDDQEWSSDCMRAWGTKISTIDLSAASDSVSTELVRWFCPPEWFALLDTLRSKQFTLDGSSFTTYHKFSSMGNATTFPLESAIFMAIAKAACVTSGYGELVSDCVRVYGDDIIVPWQCAGLVIETLRFLGFKTNPDKTFVFGPFRETCGVDLLNGVDVRPVYLRSIPTRAWNVASLYNRLLTNKFGFIFHSTLPYLYHLVDKPLWGPAYFGWSSVSSSSWHEWYAGRNSEGDAYFFAPHPYHRPVTVYRQNHPEQYVLTARWQLVRRQSKQEWSEEGRYLAFLLGLEGGRPMGLPVMKQVEYVSTSHYPQLDWFPSVYTEPRSPSDRVIRRITGEVIGKE